MSRLLIADDNDVNRRLLSALFRSEGFQVETVADGEGALAALAAEPPDVALVDLRMPGLDGLETLQRMRTLAPELPVILITSEGDIQTAVAAIRLGAFDFLTRALQNDELVLRVRQAVERRKLHDEVRTLKRRLESGGALSRILGQSPPMQRVLEQIERAGASGMTVLVLGETGTGKELAARALHHCSGRGDKPFVAIDCGAIPDALLESELFGYERGAFSGAERRRDGRIVLAQGGTLFLDEIGNLTPLLQAKLLRVLQEREVQPLGASRPVPLDVRVIAATNESLDDRIVTGGFRADLYYRLAELTIRLPPLAERRGDVLTLARHFIDEANVDLRRSVLSLGDGTAELLERHTWPGNVRELRNVIRQAVLNTDGPTLERATIRAALQRGRAMSEPQLSSPPAPAAAAAPTTCVPTGAVELRDRSLKEIADTASAEAEAAAIAEAMRVARGNKTQAARILHTDFKTLHLKMKKLGLGGGPD